jgi:hypothetical protein
MLRRVAATPEYYDDVLEAFSDLESLTILVVAGASRDQVAQALNVDLTEPTGGEWAEEYTSWGLVEVPGGVVGIETSGYGDPTLGALRELSASGRAAAVVRSNIDGQIRFGCARDGELLYDNDEYIYAEDISDVPAEVRSLFELAWDDLEDEDEDDDGPSALAVGLAMAEVVTGIELTAEQVAEVEAAEFFKAPTLVYADSLED